ncbi:MAG: VWA domain-containing protein [Bdellovibrionales bacterium]|nr:VWA domain-containing protein [Bdellovibrionales bacterium]
MFLIPLIVVSVVLAFRKKSKNPTIRFSRVDLFKGVSLGWKAKISIVPGILKVLAMVFVIVALARPQSSNTKVKRNVEGIDIVITLDISDSMLIEDMTPVNRMESAKIMIKKFIEKRTSDRIGLVVFSGESYTRVPPTLDYKILLQSVAETETQRNVKMGTAIGVALANAVARLRDSDAKSRVIILMTDGENNSGTIAPETALQIAKGFGIRVYTIGIGKDGETQLPIYGKDLFGNKIKSYQPIHSSVNDALLTQMAEETGGKYYRATTSGALDKVFSSIDQLEKTKVEVNQYTKYEELYQNYLIWGALLYFFAWAMSDIWLRRVV